MQKSGTKDRIMWRSARRKRDKECVCVCQIYVLKNKIQKKDARATENSACQMRFCIGVCLSCTHGILACSSLVHTYTQLQLGFLRSPDSVRKNGKVRRLCSVFSVSMEERRK